MQITITPAELKELMNKQEPQLLANAIAQSPQTVEGCLQEMSGTHVIGEKSGPNVPGRG